MSRLAPVALAALLAACSPEAPQSCPGQAVGSFSFDADLVTTTPLAADLDPDPALTTCSEVIGYKLSLQPFGGTLSADAASSAGALCRTSGAVLLGTRSGTRWMVEAGSDGAVLSACGSTCSATSRTFIRGEVLPDTVNPTEFRGALVEQLTSPEGACGGCVLPCAARYELLGTPEAP